jgi:hypothetical protein
LAENIPTRRARAEMPPYKQGRALATCLRQNSSSALCVAAKVRFNGKPTFAGTVGFVPTTEIKALV